MIYLSEGKKFLLLTILLICSLITFFIIFMIDISALWYHSNSDKILDSPEIGKTYNFKNTLNPYNRRYCCDEIKTCFEQVCYSNTNDTWIVYDKIKITRTWNSAWNKYKGITKIKILNSHGKIIYYLYAGILETLINKNKVITSLQVRDKDDSLLAYVSGSNFFVEKFVIEDLMGQKVAQIYRNKYQLKKYTWEFTIYKETDWRILLAIAGGKSFDDADVCNQLFIASCVLWSLSFVGLCFMVYVFFKTGCSCRENRNNFSF